MAAPASETTGKEGQPDDYEVFRFVPLTKLPAPLHKSDVGTSSRDSHEGFGSKMKSLAESGRKGAREMQKATAGGSGWADLPMTPITDEVKRDLRLLRLRGALDPKRHYKSWDKGKFPTHFAIGTVVEGAADFYSGRLTNKQRKNTLTEELLADAELNRLRKKRYNALQEEASRWSHKKVKSSSKPRINKRKGRQRR
eukprot:jgi/Botrbrau1/8710/Bobra.0311s0022.1